MSTIYKKYSSIFFISLWVITQGLQVYHEYAHYILSHCNHHQVICSHYHHKEVNLLDTTTDRVAANEECSICDYEWFKLLESLSHYQNNRYIPEVIPKNIGTLTDAIYEKWAISPFPQRGPPLRV